MKVTNQEIINMINVLQSLEEKELPILIAYNVIDNFDKLIQVYSSYAQAMEKAKTEDDIKKLLMIEKEVDLVKFNKQELIDAGISLTPAQLVVLKRLIDG